MGHRLQSSCPEATAIHILDIPGRVFVLRQDGAPAHRARDTVAFLQERKVLDFIPPTLWPMNSPDLNLVDYYIASVVYCRRKFVYVDELKNRLIDEWERFDQSIVNPAIAEWRRCRLNARVRVSGAHFEHQVHVYKFSYYVIYLPKVIKLGKSL